MILIDTSVIIGYLKDFKGEPYDRVDTLIDHNIPIGICNHVYQEVLQGAKDEKEFGQWIFMNYAMEKNHTKMLHGCISNAEKQE